MRNSNTRKEQPREPQPREPQPPRQYLQPTYIQQSRQSIQGEKRIEYIPYEKTIIEYEPVTRIEYVPKQRKVVEYYPVEYQTEYIPQVYHEKVIEYVPVERMEERVEYIPVERQIFYPPEEHPEFEGTIRQESIRHEGVPQGVPIISSGYMVPGQSVPTGPISSLPVGTHISSSRAHPRINNLSFQNSGFYSSPPPQDNSVYTKEPLPSSKRR